MGKQATLSLDLNSLMAYFQSQGYAAEIQAETHQIYFPIQITSREYPVFSRIFDESGLLQVLVFFPCTIEGKSIPEMARLLHIFNKELDLPGFGMDEVAGVVFFRWMLPTQGKEVPEATLSACLATLKTVCQTFTQVIQAIAAGAVNFETLLEKARKK